LALRAPEAGDLVGLRLQEAQPRRRLRGLPDVEDGIVEATLQTGELSQHGVTANVEPRVVDELQPVLDVVARLGRAHGVAVRDRRPGGEQRGGGLMPWPVEPLV